MHRRIPNARKLVIDNAGHAANMDQPEIFNTAVRRTTGATVNTPDVTVELAEHVATVEIHRPPNNFFDTADQRHRRCLRPTGRRPRMPGNRAVCGRKAFLRRR